MTATLDVRVIPDEDPQSILDSLRKVIDDPAVTVEWKPFPIRPGVSSRLNTDAYNALEASLKKHYDDPIVLPEMSTGAIDMAYLRGNGIQCYGTGSAYDEGDIVKGFGAHSDQERIIESELYRFAHTYHDAIHSVVGAD